MNHRTQPIIRRIALLVAVMAIPSSASLTAQQVSGEIRPRAEVQMDGALVDWTSSLRTRLAVTADLGALKLQVEGQNVHTPGGGTDALDLHQAHLTLDLVAGARITAGRQELAFGNERLVSAVDWSQYGQAFDGVLISADAGPATLQGFGMQTAAAAAGGVSNGFFWGGRGWVTVLGGTLEAMALIDEHAAFSTSETTFGGTYSLDRSHMSWRVEGWGQTGERRGADVAAWMMAARVSGSPMDRLWIHLGYDRLTDGFNTLYGTHHAFHGDADLFAAMPVRGLQDLMMGVSADVMDGVRLEADYHRFTAVETAGLFRYDYADELDVRLSQSVLRNLSVLAGASWVFAGDSDVVVVAEDYATGYLMVTATF